MASSTIPPCASAPQADLRSFIVYDEMPAGCIAHEVTDRSAEPHFRHGDFAIVDTSDRDPFNGEMFLIEWSNGNRSVVEAVGREYHIRPRDGSAPRDELGWTAEFRNVVSSLDGSGARNMRWFDGPYREEHFREKLVGRVIGIYEPDFRKQLLAA